MLLGRGLLFATLLIITASVLVLAGKKMTSAHYKITKTWNNVLLNSTQFVDIEFIYTTGLTISCQAPFYNSPVLPDMTSSPRTFDKLYNFEVVEVFLLGENDHYLEIELGPRGQYLVLELNGYRNVTRYGIGIPHYESKIEGQRWTGSALIPKDLLPSKITRFNAYAIHGSNETRTYMSLFPAPGPNNPKYPNPDFHKLELFQPIAIFQ